jgi:hypothetical protein
MKAKGRILVALVLLMFIVAVAPAAKAYMGNEGSKISFDVPTKVGNLVLVPGIYDLKFVDIWNRETVSIYSETTRRFVGFATGMPATRMNASDRIDYAIEKPANDAPQALKYLYFPDETFGIQFSYADAGS